MPNYPGQFEIRDLQRLTLTFEKGVLEASEGSMIPPGFAVQLENWIPEPDGSLRTRSGWQKGSTTSIPADAGPVLYSTRRIKGIGYAPFTTQRYIVAQDDNSAAIRFLYLPRSNLSGGAWAQLGTGVAVASGRDNPVDFAAGLGNLFMTHVGFGSLYRWDGSGALTAVTGSPAGARAVAFHMQRIFAAGSVTFPTRLFYSAIDSATASGDWPAANYIPVGQDDGEPIEDIAVFGDQLLIAKQNSCWVLSGAGPDSFQLHQIPDAGGAQGRCLIPTPYGVLIVGNENVWLYRGDVPERISAPIDNTFSIATTSWVNGAYAAGRCYITDSVNNRVYVYDFTSQAWWMETLSSAGEGPAALFAHGGNLFFGPQAGTVGSLLNYRPQPALPANRIKDYGVAADVAETFVLKTPELWPRGALSPGTFRHVDLRIRQRVATGAIPIALTPIVDGAAQSPTNATIPGSVGTFRQRIDIPGMTGYSLQLQAQLALAAGQGPVMDIEELSILMGGEGYR